MEAVRFSECNLLSSLSSHFNPIPQLQNRKLHILKNSWIPFTLENVHSFTLSGNEGKLNQRKSELRKLKSVPTSALIRLAAVPIPIHFYATGRQLGLRNVPPLEGLQGPSVGGNVARKRRVSFKCEKEQLPLS